MKYRTIVADPPWPTPWSSGGSRKAGKSSGSVLRHSKKPLPYTTMTIEEITALPVAGLVEDQAHLFMWTLDRFVIDGSAARVMRAWGFEPLPHMLIWSKKNPGLGTSLAPAHELLVIGRRGDAQFGFGRVPTVHEWKQPYVNGAKSHSAKPDGAFDIIEELVGIRGAPYLELFARRQRLGWDTWGNECRCDVEMEATP